MMNKQDWIKEQGTLTQTDMTKFVERFASPDRYFLFYETDRFQAGYATEKKLASLQVKNLLELRIFDEDMELLLRRSMLGENFFWRLIKEDNASDCTFSDGSQALDINLKKSVQFQEEETGKPMTHVMSTVGGTFDLPITLEHSKVIVRTYYDFDDDGMAYAADYRMKAFS